jgi:hypothetical protein
MGFGIGVSVLLSVCLPILSECLHRLISRFFLNLRSIAYHEPSILDSRAVLSTLSPIRTPPVRKQTSITTSFFDGLETNRSTYDSGSNTKEENILQPELVNLELMELQAQYSGDGP